MREACVRRLVFDKQISTIQVTSKGREITDLNNLLNAYDVVNIVSSTFKGMG